MLKKACSRNSAVVQVGDGKSVWKPARHYGMLIKKGDFYQPNSKRKEP